MIKIIVFLWEYGGKDTDKNEVHGTLESHEIYMTQEALETYKTPIQDYRSNC